MPTYPTGYNPPFVADYGGSGGIHNCDEHHEELFPGGALVFDLEIVQYAGFKWLANHKFAPYYLAPILVLHDGTAPDAREWRPLWGPEAVSLLAQNPYLGAVRYASNHCAGCSCEAAIYSGNIIRVRCGDSLRGHHFAYAPQSAFMPKNCRMVRAA